MARESRRVDTSLAAPVDLTSVASHARLFSPLARISQHPQDGREFSMKSGASRDRMSRLRPVAVAAMAAIGLAGVAILAISTHGVAHAHAPARDRRDPNARSTDRADIRRRGWLRRLHLRTLHKLRRSRAGRHPQLCHHHRGSGPRRSHDHRAHSHRLWPVPARALAPLAAPQGSKPAKSSPSCAASPAPTIHEQISISTPKRPAHTANVPRRVQPPAMSGWTWDDPPPRQQRGSQSGRGPSSRGGRSRY